MFSRYSLEGGGISFNRKLSGYLSISFVFVDSSTSGSYVRRWFYQRGIVSLVVAITACLKRECSVSS